MKKQLTLLLILGLGVIAQIAAAPCSQLYDKNITVSGNDVTIELIDFCPLVPVFRAAPYYWVFIEWGDGDFTTKKVDKSTGWGNITFNHTYDSHSSVNFAISGNITVTPVKSEDDEPVIESFNLNIGAGSGNVGAPPATNHVDAGVEIRIIADWEGGVRAGDIITVGILLDDVLDLDGTAIPADSGAIYLYYNSNYAEPVSAVPHRSHPLYFNPSTPENISGGVSQGFTPGNDPYLVPGDDNYNSRILWQYQNRPQNREIILFLDFQVFEDASEPGEISFLTFARPTSFPPQQVVPEDKDGDGALDNPDQLGIIEAATLILQVDASRDPNGLRVYPERVIKDSTRTTLTYMIDFYNMGTAPENLVEVYFFYPPDLDTSTLSNEAILLKKGRFIDGDIGGPDVTFIKNHIENNRPAFKYIFDKANLLGTGQGLIDARNSQGKIIFTIETREPYACDTITADARVDFNKKPLEMGPASVICVDCEEGGNNYVYWCLVFMLIIAVFLLAVWVITLKNKQQQTV